MGVEIDELEPYGVQKTRCNGGREACDIAAPQEAANHRRQRYDADESRDAAQTGVGRGPEQLS